ncbi:hypothetical protein L218DRAFT_1002245 [Marasmius fiardii PR-910]|nr:hypothetical protein L218DRAFT_1002245 [Marasmius fiardii PR-910]
MNVFRTFFIVTGVIANVVWIVALSAQGLATVKFGRSTVGILWFAIVLQLLVNVGSIVAALNHSTDLYRSQLSNFAIISVVFAGIGVDANIYAEEAVRQVIGSAWLVLAVVDILWMVYLSADPRSGLWKIFHPESTPIPESEEETQEPTRLVSDGADTSSSPTRSPSLLTEKLKSASVDGTELHTVTSGFTQPRSWLTEDTGLSSEVSFSHKAKALYDYTPSSTSASNEPDFNPISFKKGDILDVSRTLDKKWWPARMQDGRRGIAPSNYLQIITEPSTEFQ